MVFFVVLDGIIASGKSTIGRELESMGFTFEPQPLKEWTLLEDFYADKVKYSLPFQKQVLASYAKIFAKYEGDKTNQIVFLEACALSSINTFAKMLCYESGTLSMQEYAELEQSVPTMPIANYIFIDTSINVAMTRLRERKRKGEESVDEQYQEDLRRYYLQFLSDHTGNFNVHFIRNDHIGNQREVARYIAWNLTQNPTIHNKFPIAIEGLPGAGKTTFGKKLGKGFRFAKQKLTKRIKELLKKRYHSDPEEEPWKVVVELQEEFIKMYREWIDKIEASDGHDIWCWEGVLSLITVFTRSALESGEISEEQFHELEKKYKEAGLPQLEDFKVILLIRPNIHRINYQIHSRGRPGEDGIKPHYLKHLDRRYNKTLRDAPNLIVVDTRFLSHDAIETLVHRRLQEVYYSRLVWQEIPTN